MQVAPFLLERYFARHEFSARYLLSSSDCDGLALADVVALADAETRPLWDRLTLGYTESAGLPQLRAEVADQYRGVSADQVLIAAPEEGIFLAMNCLLRPGDHVVCTHPGYQSLYELARAIGCRVTLWLPDEQHGWAFDPARLERALTPQTRLVVVNFPHNPTGALPTGTDWQRIVAAVQAAGAYLFSDEMYRGLELRPGARLPSAIEVYDKALVLAGMSKVYGLAGLRLGWLLVKDDGLRGRMCEFKDYTSICSSAPSEILALVALRARERLIAAHLDRIRGNLALLQSFLAEHAPAVRLAAPRGGTVCFPRLPEGLAASTLCERALRETGVMILPSTVFEYGDAHIRVGLGRRNLAEALHALAPCLETALRGLPRPN